MGLALLDLEDPGIVLHRSDEWVFGPETPYEITGDVGRVVFPCGWIHDAETDKLFLYYGAADTVSGSRPPASARSSRSSALRRRPASIAPPTRRARAPRLRPGTSWTPALYVSRGESIADGTDVRRGRSMAKAEAGIRFDWGMALLTSWVVVGFYLDLWAHAHGMVDDTFLTPWHAFLYAGAATFGLTLGILATRNLVRGAPWRSALPGPYMVSLVGAIAFLVAGQFDFVWHSMFGFEVSVDALLSPPHLALAACGIVAFSGPIRSVWARPASPASWRRHGPAVIGLTAMLALFAAFTQYAHPVVDPLAATIEGPTARAPQSQLYAMSADGTGQHRIAISDADERNPELSPDGRRLAFGAFADGTAQIVVSDPDGSNRQPITIEGNSAGPAWSPDGKRIAFHSDRAGSLDIYTMAADGTDVRRVTTEPSSDFGPTWSPDGSRIAFSSDRDGATDIYAADADGTGVVRLTHGGGGDPAWSPDGSRIAFSSAGADGDPDVFSMAADGSDVRRLTDAAGGSYLPAWSPDGVIDRVCDRP